MLQNFQLLHSGIDVSALLKALDHQSELWSEIKTRQEYTGSAHKDTESIFLRWCETKTVEAAFTEIPAVDYPAFNRLPEARELISKVVDLTNASQVGRALLVKLKPWGIIDPHPDEGKYAESYSRFHLPLVSGDCTFFSEIDDRRGEFVQMKPGELWWFNHRKTHWVHNAGDQERIHLIVDLVTRNANIRGVA